MTAQKTNPGSTAIEARVGDTKSKLHAKFNHKSTSVEAQRHRIIEALRERPRTTVELRAIGIFQAPARIKELRDVFGFDILTTLETVLDEHGFWHPRAARYSLMAEPKGAE